VVEAGILDDRRLWSCAKGAYADPVAEHALALALAGLRRLRTRVEARAWGEPAGTSLYDQRVTILGGGGIATSLLELLRPFRVQATVVRRSTDPAPDAIRTVSLSDLGAVLPGAAVVFVALALSPTTERVIGAGALAAMDPGSWLVNVARGRHVDTDALVEALRSGSIGGAALDVTDPEPLPVGHPGAPLERHLGGVRMFRTRVHLQAPEHVRAQPRLRKHATDSMFHGDFRTLAHQLVVRNFLEPSEEAAVAPVELLPQLVPREPHLGRVDHDDAVTAIRVWGIGGLVLTPKHGCHLRGEPSENLSLCIQYIPPARFVLRPCHVGALPYRLAVHASSHPTSRKSRPFNVLSVT